MLTSPSATVFLAGILTGLLLTGLLQTGLIGSVRAADDDDLFQGPAPTGTSVPNANSFKEDDDIDIPVAVKPPPEERATTAQLVAQTGKMSLEFDDMAPLADNWPAQLIYVEQDAVVVELPVLYARNRAEFDGIAYFLVAELYADGKKVAESRVLVNRDAIAKKGPSVQFFRLFGPVAGTTGSLEIKVGKAASAAAKPTPLFSKTLPFKL